MTSTHREKLRIVLVGHVDHGKSTLVGRLIHDTGNLPVGKLEAIQATCRRRGMPFEWAFLMDAFQAEREQGVTIDAAQIWLRQGNREYVIIDAPGHIEFLKNMVTGAASADAALLVIDAHEGVQEQSRRHGDLLHLLGVGQVVVAVNKMDLVDFDEARFRAVESDYRDDLADIGVAADHIIPVSAREGANLVARGEAMGWYDGPTVLEALQGFRVTTEPADRPLRFPVQDVYERDQRRIIAGRVESGRLGVGDTLLFSPSNKTARVATIETRSAPAPLLEASAGESIAITLDKPIFVERGEVASHQHDAPLETDVFRAHLFWHGRRPLAVGERYKLTLNSLESPVTVQSIERAIDTGDLSAHEAREVGRNGVAEVTLRADRMLALDPFEANPRTGRFVLVDGGDVAGGGIIDMRGYADQRHLITRRATNVQRVEHSVTIAARGQRNGHLGGVVWLTGLSGSGKSTIALATEQRLFNLGYQVYVLDGDNVRHGLCADLGFSPEDRAENIRRIGEVAALMVRAGIIVITAFISPYRSDRARAREAAGDRFAEVYVQADLATCEARDPKGLYAKARAGEIADFTGISAPYEAPTQPELVVDTSQLSVEEGVTMVVEHITRRFTIGEEISVRVNAGHD